MLVVTLGDPWSINIEMLAALRQDHPEPAWPVVVIGSLWQWQDQVSRLHGPHHDFIWQFASNLNGVPPTRPGWWFIDCGGPKKGAASLAPIERGALAWSSLAALQGFTPQHPLAVLTCPIEKYASRLAGFPYPGQTEYFAAMWGGEALMLLAGPRLRVGLVTNHLPLAAVAPSLSRELIITKARILIASLRGLYQLPHPRIAVCGLNPHAGEQGLCGKEEINLIAPALEEVRALEEATEIGGPLAADTVFWQAYQGRWDGVLALYHDQGLGPIKTVHFDEAVNISAGLPHLRVSPDHGPARDCFLTGHASRRSFDHAWQCANRYLAGKVAPIKPAGKDSTI